VWAVAAQPPTQKTLSSFSSPDSHHQKTEAKSLTFQQNVLLYLQTDRFPIPTFRKREHRFDN